MKTREREDMGDFRNLEVWQEAHLLTLEIYKLTSKLPRSEQFGLISQIRRAAVSVESNIAEGESRYSRKEKIQFFVISRGSVAEVKTQLLIIGDLHNQLNNKVSEIFNRLSILEKRMNRLISFHRERK